MSIKPKIFFVVNESGCAFWRGRLPAEHIIKQGLADVQVYSIEGTNKEDIDPIVHWANVIVSQTPAGTDSVLILSMYQKMGKCVVLDYDDLIFSSSPFNPAYRTLGLKEVKIKDGSGNYTWLWKDGVQGFSLTDNRVRFLSVQDLLRLSDGISVTTPWLKKQYTDLLNETTDSHSKNKWDGKIDILSNSIDFNKWKPFDRKVRDHSKIRIGWVCSSSHLSELWMVEDIIKSVYKKYGNSVQFVILGDVAELSRSPRIPKGVIEFYGWTDLAVYPLKLASLELDIGICPLQDNEFNRSKSQLKWSEFSAFKIPSVVSKSPAFDCVIDGEDALVAAGDNETRAEQWVEKLATLIDSPSLRKKMGEAAFERNYRDFNIEVNAEKWVKAYQKRIR